MKLNGKPSTNTLNTLNNWLPNWLQPLVDGGEDILDGERTGENTSANQASANQTTHTPNEQRRQETHDEHDAHDTRNSQSTTIRNPTPLTTTTTVKSEHPPAPPRFNEPYFNIHEYKWPSIPAYIGYMMVIYIHIPVSIFFDANVFYVLVCLIQFNSYIWALAVYAVAVAVYWFIILIADLYAYNRYWGMGRPPVTSAYVSNRLFNLSSTRSVQHFRFLWNIRKEAWRQSKRDYTLESTHHYLNSELCES